MDTGDLNKRVVIQAQTKTPDGLGGFVVVYSDLATVWAAIWPVSATERVSANTITLINTHRIRIRYRMGFKSSWRIKFGNRYFSIVSIINPNEANEYLDLMCKEAA
jgi:SPP1 family predicted phage head-tail adaptor